MSAPLPKLEPLSFEDLLENCNLYTKYVDCDHEASIFAMDEGRKKNLVQIESVHALLEEIERRIDQAYNGDVEKLLSLMKELREVRK